MLPEDLIPYHYNLLLYPNIYPAAGASEAVPETFHSIGEVDIFVECVKATNVVVVHSNGLRIDYENTAVNAVEGTHTPTVISHR